LILWDARQLESATNIVADDLARKTIAEARARSGTVAV
jgi:hypothetical protein